MSDDVEIYGVAFMSLYHRDGRFVRGGGVFAFSRRDLDGGRTILHHEPVATKRRWRRPDLLLGLWNRSIAGTA